MLESLSIILYVWVGQICSSFTDPEMFSLLILQITSIYFFIKLFDKKIDLKKLLILNGVYIFYHVICFLELMLHLNKNGGIVTPILIIILCFTFFIHLLTFFCIIIKSIIKKKKNNNNTSCYFNSKIFFIMFIIPMIFLLVPFLKDLYFIKSSNYLLTFELRGGGLFNVDYVKKVIKNNEEHEVYIDSWILNKSLIKNGIIEHKIKYVNKNDIKIVDNKNTDQKEVLFDLNNENVKNILLKIKKLHPSVDEAEIKYDVNENFFVIKVSSKTYFYYNNKLLEINIESNYDFEDIQIYKLK